MTGVDVHVDTNIGKHITALGQTLTTLTGKVPYYFSTVSSKKCEGNFLNRKTIFANLPSWGDLFSMIRIIYFFISISGEQEFESYDSNTIDTFSSS